MVLQTFAGDLVWTTMPSFGYSSDLQSSNASFILDYPNKIESDQANGLLVETLATLLEMDMVFHPFTIMFVMVPSLIMITMSFIAIFVLDTLWMLRLSLQIVLSAVNAVDTTMRLIVENATLLVLSIFRAAFRWLQLCILAVALQGLNEISAPVVAEMHDIWTSGVFIRRMEEFRDSTQSVMSWCDDYLYELMFMAEAQSELYREIMNVQVLVAREYLADFHHHSIVPVLKIFDGVLNKANTWLAPLDAKDMARIMLIGSSVVYSVITLSVMLRSKPTVPAVEETAEATSTPQSRKSQLAGITAPTPFLTPATSFDGDCSSMIDETEQIVVEPSKNDMQGPISTHGELVRDQSELVLSTKVEEEDGLKAKVPHVKLSEANWTRSPKSVIDLSESTFVEAHTEAEEMEDALVVNGLSEEWAPSGTESGRMSKTAPGFDSSPLGNDEEEKPEVENNMSTLASRFLGQKPRLYIGQQVTITKRNQPGLPYKPGGVARITAINADRTVDVKYLVEGGRDRSVPEENVIPGIHPDRYGMGSSTAVIKTASTARRVALEDRSNQRTNSSLPAAKSAGATITTRRRSLGMMLPLSNGEQ